MTYFHAKLGRTYPDSRVLSAAANLRSWMIEPILGQPFRLPCINAKFSYLQERKPQKTQKKKKMIYLSSITQNGKAQKRVKTHHIKLYQNSILR